MTEPVESFWNHHYKIFENMNIFKNEDLYILTHRDTNIIKTLTYVSVDKDVKTEHVFKNDDECENDIKITFDKFH